MHKTAVGNPIKIKGQVMMDLSSFGILAKKSICLHVQHFEIPYKVKSQRKQYRFI